MDPDKVINLACSVIRLISLIGFSHRLVSKGNKICPSMKGGFLGNVELDSANTLLLAHVSEIDHFFIRGNILASSPDPQMKEICFQYRKIAERLAGLLKNVKFRGRRARWASMRQAIKTMVGKEEASKLANILNQLKADLNKILLMGIRQNHENLRPFICEIEQSKHERQWSRPRDWRIKLIQTAVEEQWHEKDSVRLTQLSSIISGGIAADHKRRLQAQLLAQLSHADFQDRESRIKTAHARTFKWVLEPLTTENENLWSSLTDWLEGDERIYWITGKPGSGKSTLIKYICKDPRTKKYLRTWAKSQPLVEASFYFWNSGSSIQMSQAGLLRSLLYQTLKANPSLISSALPRRWQISDLLGIDNRQWELSELKEGLEAVMRLAAEAPFKLCLFIDGLDEFSGKHKDLVDFVKSSGGHENVKLCIASRPWVVFEDEFAQGPNLRLQDLTYPDIFAFTAESLQSSSGFRSLQIREPNFGSQLVANIATKSCGVFLWVALVVKTLIKDISDCGRIDDLQKRLEGIPDDLEDLYRKMLDSIDTNYVEHAFQLFSITREAHGRLSVLALSFADDGDDTSVLDRKLGQMSDEEGMERYKVVKRRLMSRCKGFLEITNDQQNELGKKQDATWNNSEIQFWDQKITYLHRTARDFLESAPIRELIALKVGKMLDAPLRLLRSGIFILKTMSDEQASLKKSKIWDVVDTTLNYGARAEKNLSCPQIRLIDEIDKTMRQHAAADDSMPGLQSGHWSALRPGAQTNSGFLALAAQYNLQLYIRAKIEGNVPIFSGNANRPLLDYIITDHDKYHALAERLTLGSYSMPNLNLLRILLNRDSDPNQVYKSRTHWEAVLAQCIEISRNSDIPEDIATGLLEHWSNVVELFIDHGANPLVNHDSPVYSRIREAFWDHQPDRARYLEKKIFQLKTRMLKNGTLPTRLPSPTNDLDLTPFPLWNKQHSLEFSRLSLSERIKEMSQSGYSPRHYEKPYTWDIQRHDPLRGDNPDFLAASRRCPSATVAAVLDPVQHRRIWGRQRNDPPQGDNPDLHVSSTGLRHSTPTVVPDSMQHRPINWDTRHHDSLRYDAAYSLSPGLGHSTPAAVSDPMQLLPSTWETQYYNSLQEEEPGFSPAGLRSPSAIAMLDTMQRLPSTWDAQYYNSLQGDEPGFFPAGLRSSTPTAISDPMQRLSYPMQRLPSTWDTHHYSPFQGDGPEFFPAELRSPTTTAVQDPMQQLPYTWGTQYYNSLQGDNPDLLSTGMCCSAVAYTGPSSAGEEHSLTHEGSPSRILNNMQTTQDAERLIGSYDSADPAVSTYKYGFSTTATEDESQSQEILSGHCPERRGRTQRRRAGNPPSNPRLMEGPLVDRRRTVDRNTEQAPERSPRYPLDNPLAVRSVPAARSISCSQAPEELANGTCGFFDDNTLLDFPADKCRYADDFMKKHKSTYKRVIREIEDEPSTLCPSTSEPSFPDRGSRIKVAILDTGLDIWHPFIQARDERIKDVRSWVNDLDGTQDRNTGDVSGHGTHITHLLLDVAPDCDVYIARIAEDTPVGPGLIAKAVMHAVTEWKVDIISMSFGFTDETEVGCDALSDAIATAHSHSILMFAAASNMGSHWRPAFPARHSDVFCIFAADGMGNGGPANPTGEEFAPNFSALGQAVESAWPPKLDKDPLTRRKSGTSFAVPVAAGIAAMVLLYAQQNLSENEAKRFKKYDKMRDMLCRLSDSRDAYNVISAIGFFSASSDFIKVTMERILAGKWRK